MTKIKRNILIYNKIHINLFRLTIKIGIDLNSIKHLLYFCNNTIIFVIKLLIILHINLAISIFTFKHT